MSTDKWVVRAVVIFLGVIALVGMIGGLVLSKSGKPADNFIVGSVSACIGAMAALLAKTSTEAPPNGAWPPQPVVVKNLVEDPIPTHEQEAP